MRSKDTHDHGATFENRLRAAGLRPSPVRLKVLSVVTEQNRALSHQELMDLLGPSADKVTVYRTLHSLVEAGLLHAVKTYDRKLSYAPSEAHPPGHAHIQCTDCGTVACMDEALDTPQDTGGWQVSQQETLLYGVCPTCAEEPASSRP